MLFSSHLKQHALKLWKSKAVKFSSLAMLQRKMSFHQGCKREVQLLPLLVENGQQNAIKQAQLIKAMTISEPEKNAAYNMLGALGIMGSLVVGGNMLASDRALAEESVSELNAIPIGVFDAKLPTYSLQDVHEHSKISEDSKELWVVYKRGVYDISAFVAKHPGGSKILLAAGKSIEPFWQLYAAHQNKEVYKILEEYRIGNLSEEDTAKMSVPVSSGTGPYANDPERHPALNINSKQPFNAEPPPELLMQSFLTPNEIFFVRNHLPVPKIDDINDYKLQIEGIGIKQPMALSLEELKTKFPRHTVITTIQCAGNRRSEMSDVKKVKGLSWNTTAISTAAWTGVRLSDVLDYLGVNEDTPGAYHVQFAGLDKDVDGKGYGASIPLATATDPRKDVLLAFEMNGQTIPRDHGYPVRAIVPGTVGARNVKFLEKVVVSDSESPSFWQQKDYKGFPPNVDYDSVEYWTQAGPSIQELPVQSAITEPRDGATLFMNQEDAASLTVRGYAWSGGGRGIIRVDVSVDGGMTWTSAELHEEGVGQKYNRAWAWTPWEATFDLSELKLNDGSSLDIRCKAVDSSYNSQPDTIAPIWNMRGVLNNAWHQVQVHTAKTATV